MSTAIEEPLCPLRRNAPLPHSRPAGPSAPPCGVASSGRMTVEPLPCDATERTLVLVLRCLAAAGETGDAICWDEALDRAEQAFGLRDGTLVVARAAALHRSLARSGSAPHLLPLPCRRLSQGEADLLTLFRASFGSRHGAGTVDRAAGGLRLSTDTRRALADLVHAIRSKGLPPRNTPVSK